MKNSVHAYHQIKKFEEDNPKFIIVGIKHDGYRRLPPHYINVTEIAHSRNEMLEMCLFFEKFKVFKIGKLFSDEDTIKKKAELYKKQKAESAERNQYESLKVKFDGKN